MCVVVPFLLLIRFFFFTFMSDSVSVTSVLSGVFFLAMFRLLLYFARNRVLFCGMVSYKHEYSFILHTRT